MAAMHDRPRVRYFSDVPIRGTRRGARAGLLAIRIAELSRFLVDRYGTTLPADDAGRDEAFVMACHLSRTQRGDRSIREWLALRAPWMDAKQVDEITTTAMRLQLRWTADKLARRIGLDFATRVRLGLKTIGAIDCDAIQRKAIRAEKDRDRKRDKRRDSRANRSTVSISEAQPWRKEGISRSTWYARRRTAGQSASAAYGSLNILRTELSSCLNLPNDKEE